MADHDNNESNIYGSEFVDAVIDNGSAGPSRTIRFETGRLAQQAVVGADQDAVLLGRAQRDGAPLAADLRVDDGHVDARREERERAAQDECAGAHVVARDADDLYRIAGRILDIDGVRRTTTGLVMGEFVEHRIAQLIGAA